MANPVPEPVGSAFSLFEDTVGTIAIPVRPVVESHPMQVTGGFELGIPSTRTSAVDAVLLVKFCDEL